MRKTKTFVLCFLMFFLTAGLMVSSVLAQGLGVYNLSFDTVVKAKAIKDDPRPLYKDLPYKKILPPEVYKKLCFDEEAMKKAWSELVGFKAPDEVGKIAPEIKPGVYTYQDKEKYPGFKELMPPLLYNSFKPGGPPHVANFSEIKIIPTRQYYHSLPVAEATRKNLGKTRLDNQGYLIPESYDSGYPFPKPSGPFKAQQIMYNWEKRYYGWENNYYYQFQTTYTKNLKQDYDGMSEMVIMRLQGRVGMEPFGWFDQRARDNRERKATSMSYLSPRDMYGNVLSILNYVDTDKYDIFLLYINMLRRIRRMSATDSQDDVGGGDMIYEDLEFFDQKLSPKRFPYKFEVIAEREFLVPTHIMEETTTYLDSKKGMEWRNIEFERRPMYVVQLTQLDKNFVYGKRILYIDKETFYLQHIENYDQKGRLYRSVIGSAVFTPEMGAFHSGEFVTKNHLDFHSAFIRHFIVPALNLTRDNVNLENLTKRGK